MTNEWLNDQPDYWGNEPECRKLIDVGAKTAEDPARISILQGESALDPQKAEAHEDDLTGRQPRLGNGPLAGDAGGSCGSGHSNQCYICSG